MEGLKLEAGEEPQGYEEGSMGWVADRPRAVLLEGTISTRLTGVVRQEVGEWRFVHIHLSSWQDLASTKRLRLELGGGLPLFTRVREG